MNNNSPKVAVVEDDPIISWHLLRQLTSIGCNVIANFENYAEAELPMEELFPDILISNLRLSDGWVDDGYLNILEGFSMHVIILTGLRDLSLFSQSWYRPSFHYLYKPYTRGQLERCLREIHDS